MGLSCGAPSNTGACMVVAERSTFALCGMPFSMMACWACGVPGTDARTFSLGLVTGIWAKSFGSSLPDTYDHGPLNAGARNQRPETSR